MRVPRGVLTEFVRLLFLCLSIFSLSNFAPAQSLDQMCIRDSLHAHKKIGRNEERVFSAGEKPPKKQERVYEPEEPGFGRKRGFN